MSKRQSILLMKSCPLLCLLLPALRWVTLLLCIFAPLLVSSIGEGRGVGTSGNAFLKIGVGARESGMGETSVAFVDDVSSIYWNPAGLMQIEDSQLSAMHIEWFGGIRYEWIGFAQPVTAMAAVAVDVSYLHMGSIPRTIESLTEGYEEDGTFSPYDYAGRIAFATKIFPGFLVGGSFQQIQSKVSFNDAVKVGIGDKKQEGVAIDIGGIYKIPKIDGLSAGFCFQNLGKQTHAYISEREPMPFALGLGLAYRTLVGRKKPPSTPVEESDVDKDSGVTAESHPASLIGAMDFVLPADNSVRVRMGVEYRFGNGIAVRSGYRTGTGFEFPSGFCGGIGYDSDSYQIDYAVVPYGDAGNTHRVSFTVKF